MSKKKYYITTAIAYTSRKPHIGNTYEIVLTDAIARFRRMCGDDVFFLTGTDEHGQKIEEYAKAAGIEPQAYVDGVAGEVRAIWDLMNSSYDKFIRTTDDYHVKTVQKIFKKFYDQGDIYKGAYEGHYCVACETFYTETQLVDGKCPDCGGEVKQAKEEAYFFKMSKYQAALEKHIEENPDFISPESRKKEMVNNFLKPGLQDLCVSRTSFKWGIPVTFDEGHVIYVWIDALSNYITALGYDPDESGELFNKYWPADVHIIGKDILRFHTIYWPIMLMALGVELPKQVFGHPWLLAGQDKMSKSKGNVIYADDLAEYFGVDAVRYYLLSEMPYAQDGNITYETVIARYNSDLANTLGNLVNRTVAMTAKYFGGVIPAAGKETELDAEFKSCALNTLNESKKFMEDLRVADALEAVMNLAKRSNKYIDETTPWALAKDEENKERLATVMYNLLESIRFIGTLIAPFMPATAAKIIELIGAGELADFDSLETFGGLKSGAGVGEAKGLFARIDEAAKLKEIEADIDKKYPKKAEVKEEAKAEEAVAEITIDKFFETKLIACKVLACEKVEKSKKLLKFTLDDGSGKERTIASGIAAWYNPEDLVGKTVAVVANLKPVTLCGVLSQGMILSAENPDGSATLLQLDPSIAPGSTIR